MKKKQTTDNRSENSVSVKKKSKLTRRTKLAIIASLCAVVIILAIAIPVGLIFGNTKMVPTPYFAEFNDENDYYIRVKWDKIRSATSYSYIYYYGDTETALESEFKACATANTSTVFPRHKGDISFKVKANIPGENTSYSNWITINASAWKLQKPIVSITNDLDISWVASTFKADDKTYNVKGYEYNIIIDGEECFATDNYEITTGIAGKDYIVRWLKNTDKVMDYGLGAEWQDIIIEVRVKAINYVMFGDVQLNNPSSPFDILKNVYEDSDYSTASLIVTEEIFKKL